MWLFCKSGMFSAVQHNRKTDTILLRARLSGDLERLLNAHGLSEKCKVDETPHADYRFRCEMDKADWARCVMEEAENIDYGNFKNMAHDQTVRDDAYMGCWMSMARAQDTQMMNER